MVINYVNNNNTIGKDSLSYPVPILAPRMRDIFHVAQSCFDDGVDRFPRKRWQRVAQARNVGTLLTRAIVGTSFPQIAEFCGGANHVNFIHGISAATKALYCDVEPISDLLKETGEYEKYRKLHDPYVDIVDRVCDVFKQKGAVRFSSEIHSPIGKGDALISAGLMTVSVGRNKRVGPSLKTSISPSALIKLSQLP